MEQEQFLHCHVSFPFIFVSSYFHSDSVTASTFQH